MTGGATSCQPTRQKASALWKNPKFQHFKLVLGFFIFKFALPTSGAVFLVVCDPSLNEL